MINKRSIWFLTMFSLILVLSVYYITMPSELLLKSEGENDKEKDKEVVITDSSILTALRVEANDQMLKELNELKKVLTNTEATVDEKNNAFEKMKILNMTKGEEEKIEAKILADFKLKSFVKIDGDQIRVVVSSSTHDSKLANDIMRSVQSNFDKKMYITVKFQK